MAPGLAIRSAGTGRATPRDPATPPGPPSRPRRARKPPRARRGPRRQSRYAADALLNWLYATAHNQKPVNPVGFPASPAAYFAGDALSGEELHRAMARVVQAGLAEEIDTDPRTVAITPDGHECVLSGVNV